jgi:spore germination protein KB
MKMQLEQGRISNGELMVIVFGFTIGPSLILNPALLVGRDAWLIILTGMAVGLSVAFIFTTLAMRFRGKNLVEINDLIFGSFLGRIVTLVYIGYFLLVGSLALRTFGAFFVVGFYPETPLIVFIVLEVIVCAYGVRHGLEVIVRCSLLFVPIVIIFLVIDVLFLLNQTDLTKLLPFLDVPWSQFLMGTHALATFPFGETVAFLMIFAYVAEQQKVRRSLILALLFAGIFLCVSLVKVIATLGDIAIINTYPLLTSVRLINVANVFTRLELVIISSILMTGFLKMAILYYVSTLGLAQAFKLRSYLPLVIPVGIMMIVLSMLMVENTNEMIDFALRQYPYYALPFQLGLPLLSLVIAAIRGVRVKA